MKKISFILMALALVMGMTQCKKDNPAENGTDPILEGETVNITLTLGGSSNSKVDVNLNFTDQDEAPVSFVEGDEIWVVYNGKHCGKITCGSLSDDDHDQNGSNLGVFTFGGDITVPAPVGDQPLYFYFLGNKQPTYVGEANNVTGYVVDISNQTEELPVISYAPSVETFSLTQTNYTVKYNWLANQCALVKFSLENIYGSGTHMSTANSNDQNADALYTTDKCITLYGMDNQVTISFPASGTVVDPWTYDAQGNPHTSALSSSFVWGQRTKASGESYDGAIKLYRPKTASEIASTENQDAVRYAIVAPKTYNKTQENLDVAFNADSDPYGFFGTYKLAGEVVNNAFYQDAKIDLVWHSGAFSVSGNQKVVFSRGNVQYAHLASTTNSTARPAQTWRFAKHQYDWVGGTVNVEGVGAGSTRQGTVVLDEYGSSNDYSENEKIGKSGYNGWIDLFGWGTGNCPTETRVDNLFYTGTLSYYNNHDGFHDWGNNSFVNSGKPGNTNWWSTLTKDEMAYLVDTRSSGSKVGFGTIVVNANLSVHGLILLPDYWDYDITFHQANWPSSLNWPTGDNNNSFDLEGWKNMELHGAVFLPAAGYRGGTASRPDYDGGYQDRQNRGTYYLGDLQGIDAAWSLAFGTASGDDFWIGGIFQTNGDLSDDHVNPQTGVAPDNGRAVRLVHKL